MNCNGRSVHVSHGVSKTMYTGKTVCVNGVF